MVGDMFSTLFVCKSDGMTHAYNIKIIQYFLTNISRKRFFQAIVSADGTSQATHFM